MRNKLLVAVMLSGVAIAFAGAPSGAASNSSTTKPPANREDAYWFSVTNHFAGGAQWQVSVHRPSQPSASRGKASRGSVDFFGPNNATISFVAGPEFRILADGHTGSTALNHVLANVLNGAGFKVDYGPTKTPLGTASTPALLANGTDSNGNDFVEIEGYNPKSKSYVGVQLTCPPADYAPDEQVMQALDTSFRYEH